MWRAADFECTNVTQELEANQTNKTFIVCKNPMQSVTTLYKKPYYVTSETHPIEYIHLEKMDILLKLEKTVLNGFKMRFQK